MSPKELLELISLGESSTLEFKRKLNAPEKLAKEISALANTKGGCLLVGIDDDGSVYGIDSEKSEIDIIETACRFHIEPPIEPLIQIMNIKRDYIIVVEIPESRNKPHTIEHIDPDTGKHTRRAYIRMGEKSVMASREMYRLMSQQTADKPLVLSIGESEKRLFNFLEKHEKITVKEFAKMVNISDRRAERLLIRLVRAKVVQIHNDTQQDYFTLY